MIKFFRHSYIAQLIVIVLLLVVLWIPAFVTHLHDTAVGSPTTPLYNLIAGLFDSSSSAITVLTFIVVGLSALFFNSMLSVNQLVTRNSSIGAFVFVLCMCCVQIQDEYYPFLIANTFIMMAMQTIYLIYQVDKPESYLMNAGLFVAIASMFYYPAILLIFWVLLSLIIMDIRELKHFLIPIIGFLLPYFIMLICVYFNHTLIENYNNYLVAFNDFGFEKLGLTTMGSVALVLVFVFMGLSLMMLKSGNADNSVGTRKKLNVTLWLFVFGFMMLFLQKPVVCNGLIYMVLAVVVSMALSCIKKLRIIDIALIVLMLAIIANQYLPLFGIQI